MYAIGLTVVGPVERFFCLLQLRVDGSKLLFDKRILDFQYGLADFVIPSDCQVKVGSELAECFVLAEQFSSITWDFLDGTFL